MWTVTPAMITAVGLPVKDDGMMMIDIEADTALPAASTK